MPDAVRAPHPRKATGTSSWPCSGLRWLELGVIALLVQVLLIHGGVVGADKEPLFPALLISSHLLILPFLLCNFSFWGVRLLAAGLTLNLAVMLANGGLMPVDHDAVAAVGRNEITSLEDGAWIPGSKNVLLDANETELGWLSDNMLLPLPSPFAKAFSPGDLLIAAGSVLAYAEVVRRTAGWRQSEVGT